LQQVGDLFELNVKLRCQNVNEMEKIHYWCVDENTILNVAIRDQATAQKAV
jgi:hypothetical protein